MKALITGHHGYIGSAIVPVLRGAGHDVVGLDSFLYRGCDLISVPDDVRALELDLRDVEPAHLAGFDAIVHLAALSNDPLGDLAPELTTEINFGATLQLARAAKDAGVGRFVFSSSCSMYGAGSQDELVDEEAPLRPLTAYAESKVRSEEALAALADSSFSPVFLRNATAYGVSPRLRVDVVLNNLVGWAFTTGEIRILSDGTPWRPLVHVEDIGRSVACVLDAPLAVIHNEAFNVGANAENYQVRELAEIVQSLMPACRIEYAGGGDPDPRSYRVNFGKFSSAMPAFQPEWTAKDGALELLGAYRRARLTFEDFAGPRFTRLAQLKLLLGRKELGADLRWRSRREQPTLAETRADAP